MKDLYHRKQGQVRARRTYIINLYLLIYQHFEIV